MVRDLNFEKASGQPRLTITGAQDVPEVLKAAIALMLFSQDSEIRNFKGTSIINAFPTLPESGFDGIDFYLSVASARIKELLKNDYPEISDVYFKNNGEGAALNVTLNVVLDDETATTTVWEA